MHALNDQRIQHQDLQALGQAVLEKIGVPARDAEHTIDSLILADLRGVHSHGMQRLPWYSDRLIKGGTNKTPQIRIVEDAPAAAVIDGDSGLGQVVSHRAMTLAIEKAKRSGIASVSVRNSHHFGTCAYWAEMALAHQMIGIATTNGGPVMAPWGGMTLSLSNDPFSMAVPSRNEFPIVLDMATSIVAGGKLDTLAHAGKKIPLGWALDAKGVPTTDPSAGRKGMLLPIGEHKGYGLTIAFEVLAAVLGGANVARQVPPARDTSTPMNVGHYFQAIDTAAFMPPERFMERVDDLVQQMKSSELAPGHEKIRLPGEIELETEARYRKAGIPMLASVIESLDQLSQGLGLSERVSAEG